MRALRAIVSGTSLPAFTMVAALGATPAFAQSYCGNGALSREIAAAAQARPDAARLASLYRRANDDTSCDRRAVSCIGRKAALGRVEEAYARLEAPSPDLPGVRTMLRSAKETLGSPWQLLTLLGDVEATSARQTGDKTLLVDAARDLQLALNAIGEETDDKGRPLPLRCGDFGEARADVAGSANVTRIRKRASEAVMLSAQLVPTPDKAGQCGGILLTTTRGISAESVPVPITFDFKSAALGAEGRKNADDLLKCLNDNKLKEITLTGHTDAVGSDAYNMDLSAKRLATVQAYLKSGGYPGIIHVLPKGMREPFQPDDPSQYSKEQRDQLNRRVELRDTRQ